MQFSKAILSDGQLTVKFLSLAATCFSLMSKLSVALEPENSSQQKLAISSSPEPA
jgi:hypothetical protein